MAIRVLVCGLAILAASVLPAAAAGGGGGGGTLGGGLLTSVLRPFSVGLNGSLWLAGDLRVTALGGELAWRRSGQPYGALGSEYALYVQDPELGEERRDLRSWYARAGAPLGGGLDLDLRYALEDDDERVYHTARAGLRWRF